MRAYRAGNHLRRPTSPRLVWPLRQAMTSQTNPHGYGDPEARWGAAFGDSAPAHKGFPGEHPVPSADAGRAGNVPRKTGAYRRPVHPP